MCDAGNYFVIPGSPKEAWEVDTFMAASSDNSQAKMGYAPEDFVIVVVGSQLLYKGLWLEQALVLQALLPVFPELTNDGNSNSRFKIVVLTESANTNYSVAVEVKEFFSFFLSNLCPFLGLYSSNLNVFTVFFVLLICTLVTWQCDFHRLLRGT